MYIKFKTKRLLIRPLAISDGAFIKDLVNTEGWIRFIGQRNVVTLNDAEAYIEKMLRNDSIYYNVFALKEPEEPIGIVTLLHRDGETHPDFGFAILPEFESKGYAFEAAKVYLTELIKSKNHPLIIAMTNLDNYKSQGLLKKLGFTFERNYDKGSGIQAYFKLEIT